MKTFRAFLTVALLLVLSFSLRAELASGVKAIVHDSVITYQEVDMFAAPAVEVARRQFRNDREGFLKKVNELLAESLDQLVARQLILHDFQAAGYNLPESIIDENVQQRIHEKYGNRQTLIKTLQAQGMRYEQYRQQIRDTTIVDYLRWKNTSAEIIVSPAKIEKYYGEHATNYLVEDQVRLRMIVLNKSSEADEQPRKLAADIEVKLKDGAKFEEMAKVYSQGSQRTEGGKWGLVERSVLRKELADVAFTLKAGERSSVIETSQACYLMLVEEVVPAHTRALAEIRDEIEKNLLTDEKARLDKQYTDKLKKKTFVRYF